LLAVLLTAALCSCSGGSGSGGKDDPNAGEYHFYAVCLSYDYMSDLLEEFIDDVEKQDYYYIDDEDMKNDYFVLKSNGTGTVYSEDEGDKYEDDIESWSVEGGKVKIKFEDDDIVYDGTLENGLLKISLEDGYWFCYAKSDATLPNVKLMTFEDIFGIYDE